MEETCFPETKGRGYKFIAGRKEVEAKSAENGTSLSRTKQCDKDLELEELDFASATI
jgi:hypothetical protein